MKRKNRLTLLDVAEGYEADLAVQDDSGPISVNLIADKQLLSRLNAQRLAPVSVEVV